METKISLFFLIVLAVLGCSDKKKGKIRTANTEANSRNIMDMSKIEAFSDAVVYGDFEEVKKMMVSDPEIINAKDKYGFTALHNVMCEEQFEIVTFLIEKGANVNAQNDEGIAPLHLACYAQNAELLLNGGAEINILDTNGDSPLHIITSEGEENLEVIEFLLANDADKDLKNHNGQTALDIAKLREEQSIINLLSV